MNWEVTRKQLKDAPLWSVYLCPEGALRETGRLAKALDRKDLLIAPLALLLSGQLSFKTLPGLVLDGNVALTPEVQRAFRDKTIRLEYSLEDKRCLARALTVDLLASVNDHSGLPATIPAGKPFRKS